MYKWLDILRVSAIIAVIMLHVSGQGFHTDNILYEKGSLFWWISNIFNSSTRWCVPVLVMISGALNINRRNSSLLFYKKRFGRILFPLLFWSLFYILFSHLFLGKEYSLIKALRVIFLSGNASSHLWFLYMILFLYALTPMISIVWVNISDKSKFLFSFIIYFVFSDMPTFIIGADNKSIFEVSSYPAYFSLFFSFVGYYLLGKALSEVKIQKNLFLVCILVLVFLSSISITAFLVFEYSRFFHGFTPLNTFVASIAIFLIVKSLYEKEKSNTLLIYLANSTFGIYLVHLFWIDLLNIYLLNIFLKNPIYMIPLLTVIVFILSYISVFLFKRMPLLKETV